jgi:hypothetical protein
MNGRGKKPSARSSKGELNFMPTSSDPQSTIAPPRSRFQFSLRSLLLFTLVFAVFCAGVFNPYNGVRYLTLFAVQAFLFYTFLAWSIYSRGYLQTFGIGAALSFLFPWLATAYLWILLPFAIVGSANITGDLPALLGTASASDGLAYFGPFILSSILLIDSLFTGGTMVFARWLWDGRHSVSPTAPAASPFASSTTAEAAPTSKGVVS